MRSCQPRHVGVARDLASQNANHEAFPHGVSIEAAWRTHPTIAQGMNPDNSNIAWWPGPVFSAWKGICAWFIIFQEETGHTATNGAVEISGISLTVLRKTGKWDVLFSQKQPAWFAAYSENAVNLGDPATWSAIGLDGGVDVQPGYLYGGAPQTIHGGSGRLQLWDSHAPDFDAIHVSVRHRLVLKNRGGVDDRSSAKFIIQAGADYYPTVTTTMQDIAPATYYPGVGLGQFVQVAKEWRYAPFVVVNSGIDIVRNPPPSLLL